MKYFIVNSPIFNPFNSFLKAKDETENKIRERRAKKKHPSKIRKAMDLSKEQEIG